MSDERTRLYRDFEKAAITPDRLSDDELLAAFRAGNIAVAQAYLSKKNDVLPIRDWNVAIDILGDNLTARYTKPNKEKGTP